MKVHTTLANGETKQYNYKTISGLSVSQYMNDWAKRRRAIKRIQNGNHIKRVEHIPTATIEEMIEIHEQLGATYAQISRLYGLSWYLVQKAMSQEKLPRTR